jgi:hypothetical protein
MIEKPVPRRRSLKKAVQKVEDVKSEDELDKKADARLDGEAVLNSQSTRTLRETFAKRVYWYLVTYTVASFILVVAHGLKAFGFQLDTTVLALIVGSTAVSAIGLVGIVVRGLFK